MSRESTMFGLAWIAGVVAISHGWPQLLHYIVFAHTQYKSVPGANLYTEVIPRGGVGSSSGFHNDG